MQWTHEATPTPKDNQENVQQEINTKYLLQFPHRPPTPLAMIRQPRGEGGRGFECVGADNMLDSCYIIIID